MPPVFTVAVPRMVPFAPPPPVKLRIPAFTVVPPVYELCAESVMVPAPDLVRPKAPEIAPENVASEAVVPVASAMLQICEEPRTMALATVSVLLPVSVIPGEPRVMDPAPVIPTLLAASEILMPAHETPVAAVSPVPRDAVVHVAMSAEVGRASHAPRTVRSVPVALFKRVAAWVAVAENAMTSVMPRNRLDLNLNFMKATGNTFWRLKT